MRTTKGESERNIMPTEPSPTAFAPRRFQSVADENDGDFEREAAVAWR